MTLAHGSPTKIAIAGPGRSGTSLLVKILNAAGLNTPGSETEYDEVNAGRESRIGADSPFDVDKDPWLFAYAESLSDEDWSEYRALIIPIRNLHYASISRSKNERVTRLVDNPDLDHWNWDTWGGAAGGAIGTMTAREISSVLSSGLWTLIEIATAKKSRLFCSTFQHSRGTQITSGLNWALTCPRASPAMPLSMRGKQLFVLILRASSRRTSADRT
jgi:hypothetical protein